MRSEKGGLCQFNVKNAIFRGKMKISRYFKKFVQEWVSKLW